MAVQLPKGGFPYVIGGDTAGIVVATGRSDSIFKVGDTVVSRFQLPGPHGGMAEYRIVEEELTAGCPDDIPSLQACGLTASSLAAKKLVQTYMKKEDRVLVIGGSGAVGTSVIQYAKLHGAGYIVAVSTQQDLCERLGANQVVDYRTHNWWEMECYQSETSQFDVVFDMVSGVNWERGGRSGKAVKAKGRYVTLPPGVRSEIVFRNMLDLVKLMFDGTWSSLWTRFSWTSPHRIIAQVLDIQKGDLEDLLQDVRSGRLEPVLDLHSPLPLPKRACERPCICKNRAMSMERWQFKFLPRVINRQKTANGLIAGRRLERPSSTYFSVGNTRSSKPVDQTILVLHILLCGGGSTIYIGFRAFYHSWNIL